MEKLNSMQNQMGTVSTDKNRKTEEVLEINSKINKKIPSKAPQ